MIASAVAGRRRGWLPPPAPPCEVKIHFKILERHGTVELNDPRTGADANYLGIANEFAAGKETWNFGYPATQAESRFAFPKPIAATGLKRARFAAGLGYVSYPAAVAKRFPAYPIMQMSSYVTYVIVLELIATGPSNVAVQVRWALAAESQAIIPPMGSLGGNFGTFGEVQFPIGEPVGRQVQSDPRWRPKDLTTGSKSMVMQMQPGKVEQVGKIDLSNVWTFSMIRVYFARARAVARVNVAAECVS